MYDYPDKIKAFINENFKPSNIVFAEFKLTTTQLLEMLFNSFPNGCISDFDLNLILEELNYERSFTIVNDVPCVVWCLEINNGDK